MTLISSPPSSSSIFQYPPNFPNGQVSDAWLAWFAEVRSNNFVFPAPVSGYALGWDALGNLVNVPNTGADQYADLADRATAAKGAGRIGFNGDLDYAPGTVGDALKKVVSTNAVGDGVTSEDTIINAELVALAAAGGGRLYLPSGTYILAAGLDYPGDNIWIDGDGASTILKAKDGVAFETLITSLNRTGIRLSNLVIDANQANRFAALQAAGGGPMRAVGVNWTSPIDGRIHNVIVKNTVGSGTIPGVGIGIGGLSGLRNIVSNCTAMDCGTPGYASDGFYTSGTQTLIANCEGVNCVDTAFVLEGSNSSGIVGCTAKDCNAGAAITALGASTSVGNFINGLTIHGWASSVTGGVQIAALGSGDLVDTSIKGIVMTNGLTGPALNLRHPSTGRIVGISIDANIRGAATQGILVDGTDELVIGSGTRIKGTGSACIQVQTGCTKIMVDGAQLNPAGPNTYGFVSTDGTDISVANCQISATAGQMTYGVFFAGTGTRCSALLNKITGYSSAAVGSDGTTVPNVVAPMTTASGFYLGKAATTTLYDSAGVLKTDQAFTSGSAIKALGNLVQVGPESASSGQGGGFRFRNDAGTLGWLIGHLGSAGAVNWVLNDVIAGDYPLTVVSGTGGRITLGRPLQYNSYTVAGLPSAANSYIRTFVNDANATTFNSIVAGGGANRVPVFSDGTNWRIG